MPSDLTPPADLADLAHASARIGADPLLIQGPGGNTSVKDGAVMWIKASGTQLAEALEKDIFVPVDLAAMRAAMADPDADADQTAAFVLGGHTLRPSIETSLHAVFPQRVVVHVHCVETLAAAIRVDAAEVLAARLGRFDWCLVPYAKPGANLAALVDKARGPATDVVVLGNHGLIVAGDTVVDTFQLLDEVVTALSVPPAAPGVPDIPALHALADDNWIVPPADEMMHQVALDSDRVRQAAGGSLYPDHVIFCGIGAQVVEDALPVEDPPVFVIVPGKGVLLRADANAGARALARCLSDVLMRVPADAKLNYLTLEQNAELLNWDAEKYRQALNA